MRKTRRFCGLNVRLRADSANTDLSSDTFFVGLTNSDPAKMSSVPQDMVLCGQATDGLVANGSVINVQCPDDMPPSRYLIIQKENEGSLTFCELEVYAQG